VQSDGGNRYIAKKDDPAASGNGYQANKCAEGSACDLFNLISYCLESLKAFASLSVNLAKVKKDD